MRRARKKLQVETLPFLAVLLGAMGALIFFLLIMDYRAKVVTRNKAHLAKQQHQVQRAAQVAQLEADQQADWERQRAQLESHLQQEYGALRLQATDLQSKVNQAGAKLELTQAEQRKLEAALDRLQAELQGERRFLLEKQQDLEKTFAKDDQSRQEKERLSKQLVDLERTLNLLKLTRKRDTNTYSLIPYRGKHGDNRKPIYVECRRDRLVFHPDGLELDDNAFSVARFRKEVQERGAELVRRKPVNDNRPPLPEPPSTSPYVLFLVRPDGIQGFYGATAALDGFQIDYGYEFIDRHWDLDFSADRIAGVNDPSAPPGSTKPRLLPGQVPGSLSYGPGPRLGPPVSGEGFGPPGVPSSGMNPGKPGGGFYPGANNEGSRTGAVPGFGPGSLGGMPRRDGPFLEPSPNTLKYVALFPRGNGWGGGVAGGRGNGSGPRGTGLYALTGRNGTGEPGQGAEGGPIQPGSGQSGTGLPGTGLPGLGQNNPGQPGSGQVGSGPPRTGAPGGVPGKGPPGLGGPYAAVPGSNAPAIAKGDPGNGQELPWKGAKDPANPLVKIEPGQGTPPATGQEHPGPDQIPKGPRGTPGSGQTRDPEPEDALARLAPPSFMKKDTRPTPPPLGRMVSNRDFIITIACTDQTAVVLPGSVPFVMTGGPDQEQTDQALVKTVLTMIARRQALVRPGETPYRPLLRLQVYPEGLRTYYRVYPLLENLRVPMTRENLEG